MRAQQRATGMAIDASGGAVIDPTKNVEDTLNAAVRRLDDLAARDREHAKEIRDIDRANNAEVWRLQMDRLEAVRNVDVGAVQTAAIAQTNAAAALGSQVAAAAEAMRATVEATRLATTETLNSTVKPLADAISVIQQWMNQQTGQRAQVVESRDTRQDQRGTQQLVWQVIAVLATIFAIYLATKK